MTVPTTTNLGLKKTDRSSPTTTYFNLQDHDDNWDKLDSIVGLKNGNADVRVATTANITLSGAQTIDGVSAVAGDRMLVKNQTTGSQNGIYVVAAGAWGRSSDADSSAKVASGISVFVKEGTTYAGTGWHMSNTGTVTLGTTALTFQLTDGPGSASDAVIGNRTANDTTAAAFTGTITNLISGILNLIKGVTGKSSVLTAPAITLEATNNHVNSGTAHGSTSAATVSTIMQRDSAGRAKVATPLAIDDIARKDTVDTVQTNLNTHTTATTAIHGATSAATVSALMQRDSAGRAQVVDPTAAQDIATLNYVQLTKQQMTDKDAVRATTTVNITLSGTQTIDGVSVIVGDRVLVKNQTTASQNGIYVVAAGSWIRSTDADTSAKMLSGVMVNVTEGTVNGGNCWLLTTVNPITLGTTSLTFTQNSGLVDNSTVEYAAANGKLQLKDSGITLAKMAANSIGTSQLVTNSAVDVVIGNRTITDSTAQTAGAAATLTTLLGQLGNMVKAITGKANWYTVPATTLEAANTHVTATTGIHGATSVATASTIIQRDAANRAQVADPAVAADIATKGYVDSKTVPAATIAALGTVQAAALPASGNPIAPIRTATASDVLLTGTGATTIATFTPTTNGNYFILLYYRVVTGTTNVTVAVTYADGTGAQTNTMLNAQSSAVGSYSLLPLFINAVSGTAINVNVTASVANQVRVSALIMGV